jgi:hypothetical protein
MITSSFNIIIIIRGTEFAAIPEDHYEFVEQALNLPEMQMYLFLVVP